MKEMKRKPKTRLRAVNIAEKLVLFMYRYPYNQKELACWIDINPRYFSTKLRDNSFTINEVQRLN